MGLFTGTGDFFRGVFGEDDEEKRRRKERERQAAQARAAAKQAEVQKIQSQPEKPKYKSGISGFFEKAGDKLEANSPQDIYARGKQGQSGLYQETKGNVAFGQRARDLVVSGGREIAKVPETVYRSIDKGIDETPTNDINKALAEKDLNKRREMIKKITDPRGAWFQLGKTKMLDENMTEEQLIALRDQLLKEREAAPQWNSGWKRFFYGSEPLQTYQQRGRGLREEFKKNESAAQKLLEEKGGDSGKDVSEFVARNAGPVAFALAALGVGGDVIPDLSDLAKAPAKKALKQVTKEAAESTWDEVVSAGSKSTAKVITEKIAQETDPNIIKQALKVDDEVATQLATDTTSEAVEDTLKSLSVDPDFNISEEVRKKLEDEGITAVKRDKDNPYDASYNNDTITARDQSTLDANINHEIGHHIWQRRLSPEEKALFKGNGDASRQAVGRAGYSQDDVLSEDFSDYINKALTGRFSEVPPEYRDVVAKYAKITDREKELAGVIDDVGNPAYIRKQAREELDLYQKQRGAQSNYLQEASDIRGKDNPLRELQDLGANPGSELDIPAYVRRNGDELITKANARIDEITATLRRMKEVQLRQQLADSIKAYPQYKDELINGFNVAKFADNFDDLPGAEKLIDEMNALKGEIDRVTKLKQQSDRIAEAQAARAAETSPNPAQADPEMAANNAYDPNSKVISKEELSTEEYDPVRTPEVTLDEYIAHQARGKQKMEALQKNSTPPQAIEDPDSWNNIIDEAYNKSREEWGGMTIDVHTGKQVEDGADAYALTVRDPGMDTVSVAPGASLDEFRKAMEAAKIKYQAILQREGSHLGVFHDAATGRIDIDPVLVTNSLDDVRDIGAYTNAIGGAYHFKSGDGYFPPYVDIKKSNYDIDKAYSGIDETSERIGDATKETSNSPEVGANNAYRPSNEEILFPEAPEYAGRDGLNLLQKYSAERFLREKITRPAVEMVDRAIAAAQRSKFAPARGVGRFFTGVNREFGIDPATQSARMAMRGSVEYGKLLRENIADLSKGMNEEQLAKIWANLDPEQAARLDIKAGTLTPDELVLHDKLKALIDNTTAENLRRGLIDEEQANAGYIKRAYSVYDGNTEGLSKFEEGFRQELLGQYKGRKTVSDEMVETAITDPTYLVGKKTAESNAMWAMQDYGNYLSKSGMTSDVARPGYTQLPDSKVFGDSAGKWVPRNVAEDFTGFQYNNAMVSALSDVMNVYDRWNVRQAKKQILTIFNPAVRLGNQVSNRAIFSSLNGVNPVQFNKVFLEVDNMMKNGDPLYREAVQMGLTGIDITQAEFYAKRIAESTGDGNLAKKAVQWTQDSYSRADDKARIAAYTVHRRRGYSPEEAARLTQRGFQDYKSVGFFYDMAAKTPIIGNAFVRFVADSIRIAKNAVVDHPLRTGSIVALWAAFANGMSIMSGEGRGDTDEQGNDASSHLKGDNVAEKAFSLVTGSSKGADQKTRENRFGAPKIPFTNISMTTQTPWGEVNAARFMPWYTLNEVNEGMGGIQKYLPISQSPVTFENGKPQINGGGFADPILGQLFQMGLDKDFRNKSIRDPENTGNLDRDPLSAQDQWRNLARFFGVNNLPFGREADAVISSATGNPDIYGKTRTPYQAALRSMGIKVETYGDEQVQNQRETEAYFDEQKRIEDELSQMTPEAQAAWRRLTGYDKLREKVPNEFEPGTDRWKKYPVYDFPEDKWKDYSTHPELYEMMMNKKIKQARELGKQVQPEFDPRLSEGFRKQLIENKIVAPGDDAELDQRMYSDPEWDYYQNLKKAYNAQFDKNEEYTDELVKHKTADFPEKPDILKQYSAQYGQYTKGKASKPEWNDALTAAKQAYNKQTFDWTNKEREARGLNAIVWDVWNNPTFGFDETPSGFGFGFGGGNNTPGVLRVNNMTDVVNPDIKRLDPIQIAEMPQLAQLFARLQAGGGGGRAKPKLGASSTGL